MIRFLAEGIGPAPTLSGSHDPVLVILSYVVAVLASYAGLLMSERVGVAETARSRWGWIGAGAVVMGIGVWAMHFTGMLAFVIVLPVSYDLATTMISALPAILASALALYVMAGDRLDHRRYLAGGTLLGAGIGIMHYTGMAGMRMAAEIRYDPALFVLSIVVAVILGIAALYARRLGSPLRDGKRLLRGNLIGAVLMGLAISGMHYTAMAATNLLPVVDVADRYPEVHSSWLGVGVILAAIVIASAAIVATLMDRRLQADARLLQVTRQRMIEAIESVTDGFVLFDNNGRLLMCNNVFNNMYPSLTEVLKPGTSYERVVEAWARLRRRLPEGMTPESYARECVHRFENRHAPAEQGEEDQLHDGRWIYVRQCSVSSGGLVGVWSDVTPIKALQELYQQQANHDALTGLPNRNLFDDRITHAMALARRLDETLALLYLDLDGFKPINDTLGHEAGDRVLVEVAERLRASVRDTDTVARLGGDEFVILVEPHGDRATAERIAERILEVLPRPIVIDEENCVVRASIGIAVFSPGRLDKLAVMRMADAAMYEAKTAGGHTVRIRAM